jgi:anti-sigma B factor antagonist
MLNIESSDGVLTIKIMGDCSVKSAVTVSNELQDALKSADSEVELDLSEVEEIDTAGVQVLVVLRREARLLSKRLSIVAHSPASNNILTTFGLNDYFEN